MVSIEFKFTGISLILIQLNIKGFKIKISIDLTRRKNRWSTL